MAATGAARPFDLQNWERAGLNCACVSLGRAFIDQCLLILPCGSYHRSDREYCPALLLFLLNSGSPACFVSELQILVVKFKFRELNDLINIFYKIIFCLNEKSYIM